MLSVPARHAICRTTSSTTRALFTTSSLPSASSSTPAPPSRSTRTDKPKRDPEYRLRTRVLRSAAYATHELASSSPSHPTPPRPDAAARPHSKGYVAQAGFRVTPHRRAAERTRVGGAKSGRGALVGIDSQQVEASMAHKGTRHSGAPLVRRHDRGAAHSGAGPAAPTRRRDAAAGPPSSSRSLHTSAAAARGSVRLAEESLAGLDADLDLSGSADGGLWDDADFGAEGGAGGKGKARARELEMGDFVEISRNGSPTSGIYLSRSPNTARRIVLLSASGFRSEHSLDDVTHTIPSLVPSAVARRVVAVSRAAPDVERDKEGGAGWDPSEECVIEALQGLRRLAIEVEDETQRLVARGANDLFRILHATPALAPAPPALKAKGKGKKASRVSSSSPSTTPAPPRSVTVPSALAALRIPSLDAPPARHLAMHRLLMAQPAHFLADEVALRHTGRFDLRSRDEAERFERVRQWTRERTVGGELEAWSDKCARVREWGRSQRAATASAPRGDGDSDTADGALAQLAVPEDDPTFRWSATDLVVFAFLRDALAGERLLQAQPHMAIAPSLLKAVDAASLRLRTTSPSPSPSSSSSSSSSSPSGADAPPVERDVQKAQVRQFLGDVGIVAPWENWTAHERVTGLAEWDDMGTRVERALVQRSSVVKKPSSTATKAAAPPASGEFYPEDPHDAVRHDFGSATVYTIDDIGASELDDGISLAPGPPSSSSTGGKTWWVHVHVADPTALLHPGHLLAKLARVRDHTEYFPEKTWAMLPEQFVVGQRMSLGALEGAQQGQRVLSLGMRVDAESGEVLENEVKVGVVRDVRRLTYSAVDRALGYTPPPSGRVLRSWAPAAADEREQGASTSAAATQTSRPERSTDDALLETDLAAVADLRTLHDLAGKLLRARVASSALFWQFPSASVSISPKPLVPHFRTAPTPTFYASPPHVSLQLPSAAAISGHVSHADSPAQLLVSEMMVAANRSAARFAVERSIAAPFRTQSAPAVSDEADLEAVLAMRNPSTGQAPAVEVLKHAIDFLPGSTTPTPGPHWPMGIGGEYGYLKVTSPLRRYSDLFAHYQLKSALLQKSASASSFAPRLSLAHVQTHIDGFAAASKARHRLDGAASAFWALWVLQPHLDRLSSTTLSSTSPYPPSHASAPHTAPDDPEVLDLLAHRLTALALRLPTFSAVENIYVQPVLLPQLGLRGTLQVDHAAEGGAVGEEVGVRIAQCVMGPRSRVICVRR
ncbi:uncharacterized protein RHOBADRAFT_54564 [Rhodotorula graminis WP1]|uniref:RNB domain-containing protein n=1 Tax=Rhodotorula graminis (strain WP1) TaxID=578459 RepID=A0A0P9EK12_RHOGW|nr:uncharacterized protein RHOBADRAFT_54564 [Rhodotorula graminis WP1]KPV73985.1 hypothetical protein RHOBADRAFT_54564 [Rhodotorula graminis WP1]